MTDISEKILHETYKEDASKLIGNFDKSEGLTSIIPVEYSGNLEKFLFSADTDKSSVEKLQEQLNTAKKALTGISEIINDDIHECDYGCDNDCELDGSLNMYSIENIQSIIDSALAEIGGNDE